MTQRGACLVLLVLSVQASTGSSAWALGSKQGAKGSTTSGRCPVQLRYAAAAVDRRNTPQVWVCFEVVSSKTDRCSDGKGCFNSDLHTVEFNVAPGCKGTTTKARLYAGFSVFCAAEGDDSGLVRELKVSYKTSASAATLTVSNLQMKAAELASHPDGLHLCININGLYPPWPICSPLEYFRMTAPSKAGKAYIDGGVDYVIRDKAKKCSAAGIVHWPPPTMSD